MVGAAIRAGPGALGGAGGWTGAAATVIACVIPLLPCEAEVDPRLWGRKLPFPDAFRLTIPWCLRLEPRRRQRRIFLFHVSNIESSASCVANSGLRREKLFLKGARHRRPVELRNIYSEYTSAAAILYAGLTAGVLGEEGCL